MQKSKVVAAEVYDALEFAAEVEGGVGSGEMLSEGCAVCGYGLAYIASVLEVPKRDRTSEHNISEALYKKSDANALPFGYEESDDAVWAVRDRLDLANNARIPFPLWAEELGLVRGS